MKLFVWDLHGTLEQGNEKAVVELSNRILQNYGYTERFTKEDGQLLYGLKWYEYFEYLLPQESHERHLDLQEACFHLSNTPEGVEIIANHIQPSDGAIEVLQTISRNHDQIVISNTVPESLPQFLRALEMLDIFKNKSLAVNQHSREVKRTKLDALNEYIKDKRFDGIVVIGDSKSDMELAEACGAKAYLYTHAGLDFRSDAGHYKISDLREILREI